MRASPCLPLGEHSYESILDGVRRGRLRFARVRSASGRLNFLIGVSPDQLGAIRSEARRLGLGLALYGSRVSGPRLRQRELSPALRRALPLVSDRRSASAAYPAVEGVRIEKTTIKEHGLRDPRTSDLSVMVVAPDLMPRRELEAAAVELEKRLRGLGCTFQLRVFHSFGGRRFLSEPDFVDFGASFLQGNLPRGHDFSRAEIERGFAELYAPVNLPRRSFFRSDVVNGAWNAALASLSFQLALGWHPVVALTGFCFGLFGRYLARFKTWIARDPADTFASNTTALLADAAIGICVMSLVINPAAGFGIRLKTIVWASLLHTLSKGSLRLALDKRFSTGALARQRLGVFLTASLNFLQGLATAYIYAGSRLALALQLGMALVGLFLVYRRPLGDLLRKLKPAADAAEGMEGGRALGKGPLLAPGHRPESVFRPG